MSMWFKKAGNSTSGWEMAFAWCPTQDSPLLGGREKNRRVQTDRPDDVASPRPKVSKASRTGKLTLPTQPGANGQDK